MCVRMVRDKHVAFFFHQEGSVTNKMHQIYFRPCSEPDPIPLGELTDGEGDRVLDRPKQPGVRTSRQKNFGVRPTFS